MKVLVLALLVACGGRPAPQQPTTGSATPVVTPDAPPAPEIAGVALDVTPPDAKVEIDGVDRGVASSLEKVVPLEPGLHSLVVTLDGHKPFRVEFSVTDKTERLTVRLEPVR